MFLSLFCLLYRNNRIRLITHTVSKPPLRLWSFSCPFAPPLFPTKFATNMSKRLIYLTLFHMEHRFLIFCLLDNLCVYIVTVCLLYLCCGLFAVSALTAFTCAFVLIASDHLRLIPFSATVAHSRFLICFNPSSRSRRLFWFRLVASILVLPHTFGVFISSERFAISIKGENTAGVIVLCFYISKRQRHFFCRKNRLVGHDRRQQKFGERAFCNEFVFWPEIHSVCRITVCLDFRICRLL